MSFTYKDIVKRPAPPNSPLQMRRSPPSSPPQRSPHIRSSQSPRFQNSQSSLKLSHVQPIQLPPPVELQNTPMIYHPFDTNGNPSSFLDFIREDRELVELELATQNGYLWGDLLIDTSYRNICSKLYANYMSQKNYIEPVQEPEQTVKDSNESEAVQVVIPQEPEAVQEPEPVQEPEQTVKDSNESEAVQVVIPQEPEPVQEPEQTVKDSNESEAVQVVVLQEPVAKNSTRRRSSSSNTIHDAKQRRDRYMACSSHVQLSKVEYTKSVYKLMSNKSYKGWSAFDQMYNQTVFQNTKYDTKLYGGWYVILVDGVEKCRVQTSRDVENAKTQLIHEMEFPFTIGVFQIPIYTSEDPIPCTSPVKETTPVSVSLEDIMHELTEMKRLIQGLYTVISMRSEKSE